MGHKMASFDLERRAAERDTVMVAHSPTLNPKGFRRRHLRVYMDGTGAEYVRVGKRGLMRRYLREMAYKEISEDLGLRIYYEYPPEGSTFPEVVRPRR
jgi:hypothetical protein